MATFDTNIELRLPYMEQFEGASDPLINIRSPQPKSGNYKDNIQLLKRKLTLKNKLRPPLPNLKVRQDDNLPDPQTIRSKLALLKKKSSITNRNSMGKQLSHVPANLPPHPMKSLSPR